MKLFLMIIFSVVSANLFAQSTEDTIVYKRADVRPEFPGGQERMQDYINFRMKGDQSAFLDIQEGKITVEFVVEKNGRIGNVKVVQSLEAMFDQNFVDLIQGMPKWSPASIKGAKVRYLYSYAMDVNYYMR